MTYYVDTLAFRNFEFNLFLFFKSGKIKYTLETVCHRNSTETLTLWMTNYVDMHAFRNFEFNSFFRRYAFFFLNLAKLNILLKQFVIANHLKPFKRNQETL